MTDVKTIFRIKPEVNHAFVSPERQSVEATENYAVKKVLNTIEGTIDKTPVNDKDIVNKKYVDDNIGGGGAPEGTAVKSTGESGGTKFLREDGDNTCSWQTISTLALGETDSTAYRGDRGKTAYDHSQDNTQAHSDYLRNDEADAGVSLTLTGDNSSADTAYVPMVLYNTDATPPAASGFPVGTIYIQYTP